MVYVVERYLPGLSRTDLLSRLSALEQATMGLPVGPSAVRYLGSTIVLEDEACFCQFEGPSQAAVAEANRRAGLSFDRIVPAVTVEPMERSNPMNVSAHPATITPRRTRLFGLIAAAAITAAAIWAIVAYASSGSQAAGQGARTQAPVLASLSPAGRTEARGYLAISRYLATRTQSSAQAPDLAGQTEAKGFLAIERDLATRNQVVAQAPDLAGRTEAKGYIAIAHYLATRTQSSAQAPDLTGQTEAKGFLAIERDLATRNPVVAQAADLAGQTEAKGYLAISRYLATRNQVVAQVPDLAGRTEAKGYVAISRYLASQGPTEIAVVQPGSFHWGDAGIGAALAAGVFLLGAAAGLFLRRRRVFAHLPH